VDLSVNRILNFSYLEDFEISLQKIQQTVLKTAISRKFNALRLKTIV
jgi:hypothetical protein